MKDPEVLKNCLERLAADYDSEFLNSDPVGIVHRFSLPTDIEIAGFVVSALSFGNARQIRKSAVEILNRTNNNPTWFARDLTPQKALDTFGDIKYRWAVGSEIAFLFWVLGRALDKEGSLGALVQKLDNPADKTIEGVMIRLSDWICGQYSGAFGGLSIRPNISYFVPSPAKRSACKRLAMFFRWMVRGPDDIDFGLWKFISPARLVIPLDIHIARMAKLLGLSSRRTPGWNMALEITDSLRKLDPDDPVKYDFALVRPGILGECTTRKRGDCSTCILSDVCLRRKPLRQQ